MTIPDKIQLFLALAIGLLLYLGAELFMWACRHAGKSQEQKKEKP